MTSPVANLGPTELILTFTWSPGLVCGTKTTSPSIRATPSPRRLTSLMSSSYSLPSSTGLLKERSKLMRFTSVFHSASSSGEIDADTDDYGRTFASARIPNLSEQEGTASNKVVILESARFCHNHRCVNVHNQAFPATLIPL